MIDVTRGPRRTQTAVMVGRSPLAVRRRCLENVIKADTWGQVKVDRQTGAGSREALKSILGISLLTIGAIGRYQRGLVDLLCATCQIRIAKRLC